MQTKPALNMQSVQATMLLPLWGRAEYSLQNPEVLKDDEAINDCDYDFSALAKSFGEYAGICYIVRARKIDDTVQAFISRHPNATIVNIGAGLDTTFSRVDNGKIKWYNLDLPDAIAFRQTLIPDSERNICIAKSFFDMTWFDDIDFNKDDGIFFVAGGVFHYFREDELKAVVAAMATRFPAGELYFDTESKRALSVSNRMVKRTGNKNAMMYFYVNDVNLLQQWSPQIAEASCEPYFKGSEKKKSWSFGSRMSMTLGNLFGMVKFIQIKFAC